jgi:lipopolysaccharide assembly outer membrane protein LptD (OstA)
MLARGFRSRAALAARAALAIVLAVPTANAGPAPFDAANAAAADQATTPGSPARPAPKAFGKGPGGCELTIAAGPGSILEKDELILKDYVDIRCGDLRLQADLVRYLPATHEAHAEGNVVLDQQNVRVTADILDYNLESQTGQFLHARGYTEPTILFEAERIEQVSKDKLILYDANFTACTQPTPYWSFKIGRGELHLGEYAYLHDMQFKVGAVTVFYTPFLVWPMKSDRASGLLFPEFGFSKRSGTILSDAWYWAMSRSQDSTVYVDYMSKAGIGVGTEYRYVPSATGRGMFTGYFIRDQVAAEEQKPGVPTDRWMIAYTHTQQLADQWHLIANANFISDFDYYLDFERDLRVSSTPQALSNAYLTRSWGFYSLNMWGERREQLVQDAELPTAYGQPSVFTVNHPITRWIEPEIEARGRRQRIGDTPLYFEFQSSVDHFVLGDQQADYNRADVYPVISSQLSPVPWIDIDANAGARDTRYSKSQASDLGCDNLPNTHDFGEGNGVFDEEPDNPPIGIFGPEDDVGCDGIPGTGDYGEGNGRRDSEKTVVVDQNFERRVYQAGLDIVGPKLSRVFDTPSSGFSPQFKNTIEPTIRYLYLSDVQSPASIIRFDDVDVTTNHTNMVTYGFTTRLFAKRPAGAVDQFTGGLPPVPGSESTTQDALARALMRVQADKARQAAQNAEASGAQGAPGTGTGDETTGETGAEPKKSSLSTVEIASFELTQDYSFLQPLSVSAALNEQLSVSPVHAILRVNPSINTSLDVRSDYDVIFKQIRDASLSANLRSPTRGFLDFTWTMSRDLEGRALESERLATLPPFDQSQLGLQGEGTFFRRRLLLGFQTNYELGTLTPGEVRFRDQRYRAGYNTQCCGFQFEYLNRNFIGSNLTEFRFLVNLKGVGNVVDLHQSISTGGP